MIEAQELSKRFGDTLAVDRLSFTVPAGQVTGFLGPNGAGKSTTMRMIIGLDRPTSGSVTVNGKPYASMRRPLREVGALLDARAAHPGRTAVEHLRCLALSNGIPRSRVDEVLGLVGLADAARRRAGEFSLGMGQRLGIAAALLGDPRVIILDEPVNGLDPDGVVWVRNLVKSLAAEGRTVLLSSHLMSEMALTADRLLIIGRGRLIADCTIESLLAEGAYVSVRSPQTEQLGSLLHERGVIADVAGQDVLNVRGSTSDAVAEIARAHDIVVLELRNEQPSLEERYMEITGASMDFRALDRASSVESGVAA
jgi:ABC-2 type transport system ATP-binding protein